MRNDFSVYKLPKIGWESKVRDFDCLIVNTEVQELIRRGWPKQEDYTQKIRLTAHYFNLYGGRKASHMFDVYQLLASSVHRFDGVDAEHQYGFRKGRSISANPMILVSNVRQVDAVYTDFNKDFDRVYFNVLLGKLGYFDIFAPLFSWLQSYPLNRNRRASSLKEYQPQTIWR